MKIRNVFAWIGIILCALAFVAIAVSTWTNPLLLLVPVAFYIPCLMTLRKNKSETKKEVEDECGEDEAEKAPKKKINWPLLIAWCLVGLLTIITILVAIFFGWWFLIGLIALLAVFIWLTHLCAWPKLVGKLLLLAIIIAIVWFGVFAVVATVSGNNNANFDTIYTDNLVVKDDVMVEDDLMVNGNLAVNNDVIVNQGDVNVNQGDVNVDNGSVNVDQGDVNVNNGDVNVEQGDVNVDNGDVNVDQGDLNVGGDANIGGNVNEGVEPPATEPPATEPPATEPPATEPPATEPPATEPPATEPPATEPPATAAFTLVASGEGWWEVKFEGMNPEDIVLDSETKGSIEWLSANTLKVTKTCDGTCYFSLTDNVSGEVIYLF